MSTRNKIKFGILAILAITALSTIAIYSIKKTHENIVDCNKDIDWDI